MLDCPQILSEVRHEHRPIGAGARKDHLIVRGQIRQDVHHLGNSKGSPRDGWAILTTELLTVQKVLEIICG